MRLVMTLQQWAETLETRGGFAETEENTLGLVAWAVAEGSHALWNPLDTTMPGPAGTTDYNAIGVRNYPSLEAGLAATLATLRNGLYPSVLAELAHGGDAGQLARAVGGSKWGTGGFEGVLAEVRANPDAYYSRVVAGSSEGSPPPPGDPPSVPPTSTEVVTVQVDELREGASGPHVRTAQAILNVKHAAGLATDGAFGPLTDAAVRSFQTARTIGVDGIVGPVTWQQLVDA